MTKLTTDARLPMTDNVPALKQRLYELQRDTAAQVNALSDGAIRACTNAATAAPATGNYAPGDFVRNSAPAELGTAGSKYVVLGFVCVSAGPPAVFKECRVLTGG